jgi:hypothetical protein
MSLTYVLDFNGVPVAAIASPQPVPGFQSGIQPVYVMNGGSGGTASSFGAPFPALGTPAGASDGTNMQPLLVDGSGKLLVAGSLTVTPTESSTVSAPSIVTVGTGSSTLLAANSSRKRLTLQNMGTRVIFILFGAGTASSSNYHIALPPGGTTADGSSPVYSDIMWQGAIQASASGAGGSVAVGEFT